MPLRYRGSANDVEVEGEKNAAEGEGGAGDEEDRLRKPPALVLASAEDVSLGACDGRR